jgi:hypothetical protein
LILALKVLFTQFCPANLSPFAFVKRCKLKELFAYNKIKNFLKEIKNILVKLNTHSVTLYKQKRTF